MSIHQIYIRILILAALLGPLAWLLFTDDGQRVGDILMLEFSGAKEVDLNFAALSARVNEAGLKQQFPKLELNCSDRTSAFGSRVCTAAVAAINGTPAQYMNAYFYQDRLTALKIGYQASYHDYLYEGLMRQFGEGEPGPEHGMRRWPAGDGMLYAPPRQLEQKQETALLWLATMR